ncbi:MAG: chromosomal replication initiator DnaA [Caulobacteraceae bacterium]|nr:chromosomal replication initiator DnaA [Caulobacteraceae bacterium]
MPLRAREESAGVIVSPANAQAVEMVRAWPAWPGGRLALVGPRGSGKTRLAEAWARVAGATTVGAGPIDWANLEGRPALLDDADRLGDDAVLFHLINLADAGAGLLLTARADPRDWTVALPDLRSRLNALSVARLHPPDDLLLTGLLRKFFRERHIRPDDDLLSYLVRRIERSAAGAKAIVAQIDEAASASKREVTRALAREVLEGDAGSLELFD